ncbi:CLUMA_CG008800, isoform A [Clunio marinus]|uniref:CLUMA_CG008800, isoform A n=1 Tax=Clunio marinus TaxID=568069 RepID=A0A1J1I4D6_9DIPT|nr:CLUMA_CG008800, isoform A [Clunio marinus]
MEMNKKNNHCKKICELTYDNQMTLQAYIKTKEKQQLKEVKTHQHIHFVMDKNSKGKCFSDVEMYTMHSTQHN